jgi:hypothetical protein
MRTTGSPVHILALCNDTSRTTVFKETCSEVLVTPPARGRTAEREIFAKAKGLD